MKMHKVIGEARASARSIFNIALVGVLLTFAGHAFAGPNTQATEGPCSWPDDWATATGDTPELNTWNSVNTGDQGLNDLDSVESDTLRFRGATGTDGTTTLTTLTFPAPTCDFDDDDNPDTNLPTDFWQASLSCGGSVIDDSGTDSTAYVVGGDTSTDAGGVQWVENTGTDGQIDFTFTAGTDAATGVMAASCTLSLDWVGSNDDDGPIEYAFDVAIVPSPHAAPTMVRAVAESYNSIYVEWDVVGVVDSGDPANPTPDTTPTSYYVECTTDDMGARDGSRTVMEIADVPAAPAAGEATTRQGARITGLTPDATYSCTVAGRSGSGTTTNYGRTSDDAFFATTDLTTTPITGTQTAQLPIQYIDPTGPTDNTYELSMGETVEIDPETYFMSLALSGRVIPGVSDADMTVADNVTEYDRYLRGTNAAPGVVATYAIASNKFVDVLYISTDPNSQAEDLVRLKGLEEGMTNLTLVASLGMETITSVMRIKVIENHEPRFSVTEATVRWHVDKESPTTGSHVMFDIDVMAQFGNGVTDEDIADPCDDNANNDVNCDEELTFSIGSIPGATGYTSYRSFFEIKEEHEHSGIVSGKINWNYPDDEVEAPTSTTSALSAYETAIKGLDDGDEIGMRVTVTDAAGGKDTIDIIVAVSTEGNFPPELTSNRRDPNHQNTYLNPLSEAAGGGTRKVNLASKFRDPDGDALCYEISAMTLGEGTGDDDEVWAEAELGRTPGHLGCDGPELTIKMILPSSDPDEVGFNVLGKYGRETIEVMVVARERTANMPANVKSPATRVRVDVIYGTNAAPTIRNVASNGSTFYASGNFEIVEEEDIRLTFTADDAQPAMDYLCWNVSRFSCRATPCTGNTARSPNYSQGFSLFTTWDSITASSRRSKAEINGGQSHTYDLVISGTQPGFGGAPPRVITDFETNDGTFSFNVCATDLSGATTSLPFEVKLKDKKEAPTISSPGSGRNAVEIFMLVGDYSQTVDIRARDGDGDSIEYGGSAVGSCPVKVDVNSDTGEVELTPPTNNLPAEEGEIGKATCQIEVWASDGEETVYSNPNHFTVTVKNENSAPTFSDGVSGIAFDHPENRSGRVGTLIRVTDADMNDDDDGDMPTATISGSNDFSASVREVRSERDEDTGESDLLGYDVSISLKKAKDHEAEVNSYDFTLVVTDEYGGASELDVTVDITDVNEKPTLVKDENGDEVEIEDQNILVGVEKCIARASEIFEDPDERDKQAGLYIEASTTRPGDASVSIKHNDYICITGHNVGNGPGRVKVTASDRDGEDVSISFRVTVEANEAPTVVGDGIPDQEVQEHGRSTDIDLTEHFDDGDVAYEEELTFSFEVERASIATAVLIDGNYLRIYGDTKGETEVTVTATDQNDSSVSHTFEVEVLRNDPPVANADAFDDVEQYIGREYDPIDAREAFTDEGDTLTYYVSTKNPDIATAAIKYDDEGGAWVVLNLHSPGTTSVTVTVYDSANNDATNSFSLTVLARNDAPRVANPIEDVEVEVGASHDIPLEDVFEDEGSLDYDVANEDENIADVFYRASENEIRIYANNTGTTTVVVTATDNIGQEVHDTFEVTVVEPPPPEPTNNAPILSGTLDNQTVTAGEPIDVSIEGVFTDPDGDELTYTAESGDDNVATLELSGLDLTINGVNAGTTIFSITATDGEFNVVGEFDVIVETVPVAIDSIPNQSLAIGGENLSLNVSDYFFDQDGDVLSYTIESSGNAATVSLTDADVDMSPFTRGSTSVTVTASDPKGRSATQTFSIAVGDDELRAVGQNALAGIGRAYINSTAAALSSRLETSRSETGIGFGFGVFNRYLPVANADTVDNTARQARSNLMGFNAKKSMLDSVWNSNTSQKVDFNFELPSLDSMITNNFSRTLNGNGGIGSWSVWGTADAQNFEGAGYDGNSNSLFLGIDVKSNECWLFGVTVARNSAESDYSWGTATQTLETNLTTILPYFSYEPVDGKTSVWGVVGRGSGDADTTVVNAAAQSSDLSFDLFMGGGRREFAKAGSLQLAFRGDVAFANLETADGDGAIDALAAGVNRVRAGIEGSFSIDTGNGGKVTPFGELAFRNDGGDGLTGNGVEIAGGVRVDTNSLTLEARGRMLATHSADDFSETGVSLMLNFHPSSDETGLSFSLTPEWGVSSESTGAIWSNTGQNLSASPYANAFGASNGLTLTSKLAYGFAINHGKFLLTPYVDVQDTGWYGKTVMVGTELLQVISGPRSMNMKMFYNASDDSVDQIAPKLGVQALFKF